MNIHNLDGCAPVPLAYYLKALGILRLVAEQADPQARGWWEGDRFRLATKHDRNGLEQFFLATYKPTPVVAPWNKGSGFYYENDPALKAFESAKAERVINVTKAVKEARLLLNESVDADNIVRKIKEQGKITKKDRALLRNQVGLSDEKTTKATKEQRDRLRYLESKLREERTVYANSQSYKKQLADADQEFKRLKSNVIPRIYFSWRGLHREWLDAAVVLNEDGTYRCPALLGTGGNDGRLDFTNNFFQRFNEIFDLAAPSGQPREDARMWLRGALWGGPVDKCQTGSPVGQYLPGMAGGANSTAAPDGNSLLNPFDFILLIEGTVLFKAHMTRRLGTSEQARVAAPFSVDIHGAGYPSAPLQDEASRGEQWMPLWSHPLGLLELKRLLAEGRIQLGKHCAKEPLDLAQSIVRFGSARGISAFQRYTYVKRYGESYFAVPVGRFKVSERLLPSVACVDDLHGWLGRLRREARSKGATDSLKRAQRRLFDALFFITQHPEEHALWQSILLALNDVEGVMRTGTGFGAGPIPPLRPEWVEASNDGSVEYRLALTFALQAPEDPLRRHWLPLTRQHPPRFATIGSGSLTRLAPQPELVMAGRSGLDDATAVMKRRIVERTGKSGGALSLLPSKGAAAAASDLAALVSGGVNLDLTLKLARALMALDRGKWAGTGHTVGNTHDKGIFPDDGWLAVRLAMSPYPLPPEDKPCPLDPAITRRLESGDALSAVRVALQRLRSMGIKPSFRFAAVSPGAARLWLAALAFPVSKATTMEFLRRITGSKRKEHQE